MNEDVNTYCTLGSRGGLFLTIPFIALQQSASQGNSGGITDTYLYYGTYVKSFYTVMQNPSSVKISMLISNHQRIHHSINWSATAPKIISDRHKK